MNIDNSEGTGIRLYPEQLRELEPLLYQVLASLGLLTVHNDPGSNLGLMSKNWKLLEFGWNAFCERSVCVF